MPVNTEFVCTLLTKKLQKHIKEVNQQAAVSFLLTDISA